MAHFMMRWRFSDTSVKALVGKPQDRSIAAKSLIEGFGGKLHSFYFTLGEHDGLAIFDLPDITAATACSMALAATGAVTGIETTPLLTAAEAETAMKQARDTKTGYQPPSA